MGGTRGGPGRTLSGVGVVGRCRREDSVEVFGVPSSTSRNTSPFIRSVSFSYGVLAYEDSLDSVT